MPIERRGVCQVTIGAGRCSGCALECQARELVVMLNGEPMMRHAVTPKPLMIGRSDCCDIRLADARASRLHCLLWKQGGIWVRDLGSTNRTYVNGNAIDISEIGCGDLLRVGDTFIEIA